jgi:hypothetical protein
LDSTSDFLGWLKRSHHELFRPLAVGNKVNIKDPKKALNTLVAPPGVLYCDMGISII